MTVTTPLSPLTANDFFNSLLELQDGTVSADDLETPRMSRARR
jgi:hypothetical protein